MAPGCRAARLLRVQLRHGTGCAARDGSPRAAGSRRGSVMARGHLVPPGPGRRVRAAALPWQLGTSRQACEGDGRMRARGEREDPVAF